MENDTNINIDGENSARGFDNKKIWIPVLIVLLVVVGFGLAKSYKKSNFDSLKIGAIMSLTGDYAGVSENLMKGIRVAQLQYEKETGRTIELVVEDDAGDATRGLSAYEKLSRLDQVEGLINFFTTTMDAIYDRTKTAGYPVMMIAFQANNVADDHVFQITPGNDHTWDRYATYLKNAPGYDRSRVILIHEQDAGTQSFAQTFASHYGENDITLLVASSDLNSLRADAARISAANPTTVLIFMGPESGAILTRELLNLLPSSTSFVYDTQLMTGLSFYADILGDLNRINGAITLFPEGDPDQNFIDLYRELYNEDPGFLADFGYDTFNIYIRNYHSDNARWIANIRDVDTRGASGHIKFDENGVRVPDLVIKTLENGELRTTQRLPLPF